MVRYFARVPSAAVFREIDGHQYAHVDKHIDVRSQFGPGIVKTGKARMLRADDCKHLNGEAWIYIGSMGDAIAQHVNLPFDVSTED